MVSQLLLEALFNRPDLVCHHFQQQVNILFSLKPVVRRGLGGRVTWCDPGVSCSHN